MEFLALIIVLILQLKFEFSMSVSVDQYFKQALRIPATQSSLVPLSLVVAGYTLAVALIFWLLSGFLWGIASFGLEVLVLLGLMGESGFRRVLESYIEAWRRGDYTAADHQADKLSGHGKEIAAAPPLLQMSDICQVVLLQFFRRYFSVMFWFFLAGPAFAILVRILQLVEHVVADHRKESWHTINQVIEWLPARLLALSFALAGNLGECVRVCRETLFDPTINTVSILDQSAAGALDHYNPAQMALQRQSSLQAVAIGLNSIEAVRGLLNRTLGVWLGIFAIIAIFTL